MAYPQRWFRLDRPAVGPLKDDSVADDRDRACRLRSIRIGVPWRHVPAWALLCAALTLPAVASAQPDPKTKDAPAAEPAGGLPPDYQPPLEPLPEMLLEQRLLTTEEQTKFRKELSKTYAKRIRAGDLRDDPARAEVRNGIRYRLNELTIPDNRKQLSDLRTKITGTGGDLQQAGRLMEKADQVRDFRRKLLQMIVDETIPLFENNYHVRVQAALLLGELNLMEENAQQNIKREAFAPAAKPLCRVLEDPKQPEGVKIVSVLSLMRILMLGNPNVEQKREIATALVSELKRPDTDPWYQRRLAEALGYVDVSLDLDRNPFVFDVLNSIIKDPNRDIRTRVQAAWALGRHPLEKSLDVNQLTVDIAALANEIAQVQKQEPKSPDLKRCALLLYLAFQAKDETDRDAKRERAGGLLNDPANAGAARTAYQKALPIVREIFAGKTVPPERVQELSKWLEVQKPSKPPAGNAAALNK